MRWRCPQRLGEQRHQVVAEIVVVDRLAAQPGIGRRQVRRAPDRGEERDIHELLGVHDLWREGPHPRHQAERASKDDLAGYDIAALRLDELGQRQPHARRAQHRSIG